MDREEKNITESGTQKRPVHRRPRRPDEGASRGKDGSAVTRRPEGSTARKTEGTPARRPESGSVRRADSSAAKSTARRADGSAARSTGGTDRSAARRTEGSAVRSAGSGTDRSTARRTDGSSARRLDGSTARRTDGNSARRPDGSTARRTDGNSVRRPDGSTARRAEGSSVRRPGESTARRTESGSLRGADRSTSSRKQGTDGRKRPSAAAEELRKNSEGRARSMDKSGQPRKPGQQGRNGQQGKTSSKKKQQKRARFNVVSSVVLVAAVCVFVFSLYQLVAMLIPYYSGSKIYDEIKDLAITADGDGTGFQVDFDALLEANPDTVAWIRFDEPAIISYPVVKSADNADYLTKTFTADDNKLGAIFMDMRNSTDFSDRNTFIYGHHLNVGGEMFSELLEYESESFCKEHPNFYIYTPDGHVRTYTVFSAGVVKDTADNYKIDYASDAEFEEYIQLCRDSSNYTVDVEVNAQSQIVSLSTCTNVRDDERFLVQGVLTATD